MKKSFFKKGMFSFFKHAMMIVFVLAVFCIPKYVGAKDRSPGDLPVTGTVKDKLGKPIADVTVKVVGSNVATTTDVNGAFAINVGAKGSIEFSRVGYKPQTIAINNTIVWDISLDAKEGNENEVVVVGYGKQRKISQIGAQSTLNLEDSKQPIANVGAGLAGRLSGLVAVQRTGEPGHDDADIFIRGISTLNSSTPLVLVDGVERSLSNINYDDIASFSILKDASATAVYGVRGANGVVLITTKRGKPG